MSDSEGDVPPERSRQSQAGKARAITKTSYTKTEIGRFKSSATKSTRASEHADRTLDTYLNPRNSSKHTAAGEQELRDISRDLHVKMTKAHEALAAANAIFEGTTTVSAAKGKGKASASAVRQRGELLKLMVTSNDPMNSNLLATTHLEKTKDATEDRRLTTEHAKRHAEQHPPEGMISLVIFPTVSRFP